MYESFPNIIISNTEGIHDDSLELQNDLYETNRQSKEKGIGTLIL